MKLLAVDDDPIFLELLVATLDGLGYHDVTPVSSAMEALHELDTAVEPFDCLLFDIQMPKKDGITLTREVRQQSRLARTPIVMITSVQQRDSIDQAFAAGANDYIVKPIQAPEIAARLGMIEKIAELSSKVSHSSDVLSAVRAFNFNDAIALDQRDHLLDYLALENYLLTIGRLRMSSVCAFGIELDRSSDLFARLPQEEFVDLLNDIAAIVLDQVHRHRPLLAYAGSGRFVVVLPKFMDLDTEELEAMVNAELGSLYSSLYLPDDQAASVLIGPVRRPRVLNGFSAKALLADVLAELSKKATKPTDGILWKGAA